MIDQPESTALKRCFSTLGCVDLSLPAIISLAGEFGLEGLELRGFDARMDMPGCCSEKGYHPETILGLCRSARVSPRVIGTSVKLVGATEKDRAELLEFGSWAESLAVPYLRVFGGGAGGQALSDADYACGIALVEWWREQRTRAGWKVDLLLETHDAFSASAPCLELNRRLAEPLGIIWDTHHTWRLGGESPEFTWAAIRQWVRHAHVKDSIDRPSARHPFTYVLPGDGQMPVQSVVALLLRDSFPGFVSLEWERHWHPYLPPIRDALSRIAESHWFAPKPPSPTPLAASRNATEV